MCLMAFALHTQPELGLLLAANRDEALDRPTLPLHRWHTPAGTAVWAGRDVREGGTWLGSSLGGRVGLLTNVRDPASVASQAGHAQPFPRSRGELVTRWLDTTASEPDARQATQRFTQWLQPRALDYGGFNLVLGDVAQGHWVWLNNRPDTVWPKLPTQWQRAAHQSHGHLLAATLPPGVYGLSNAGLDTAWPKTLALREALQQHLAAAPEGAPRPPTPDSPLWAALANPHVYPDDQLPHTGVPWAWERALSAAWVDMPSHTAGYGTRSSLLMQLQRQAGHWHAHLLERTWRPAPQAGWASAQWHFDGSAAAQTTNQER